MELPSQVSKDLDSDRLIQPSRRLSSGIALQRQPSDKYPDHQQQPALKSAEADPNLPEQETDINGRHQRIDANRQDWPVFGSNIECGEHPPDENRKHSEPH